MSKITGIRCDCDGMAGEVIECQEVYTNTLAADIGELRRYAKQEGWTRHRSRLGTWADLCESCTAKIGAQ